MNKPPAFQFYAKDFLTGTMEMSLLEIGAYTKLLAWSWDNGPVPSDDRRRAVILGVSERSLRVIWDGISDKWVPTPAGYVNERLERQRSTLAAYSQTQATRAHRRWKPAHSNGSAGAHATASASGHAELKAVAVPAPCSAVSDLQSSEDQEQEPTRLRAYPPAFEDFWRAYPNKTGKGAALKAWLRIKPDAELLAQMFEALGWQVRQAGWVKDKGRFVPHPATWLNGRRWEDELHEAVSRARTSEHWSDECARLHEGRCGSRTFHEAKMAEAAAS